jgi:hypothetical protein
MAQTTDGGETWSLFKNPKNGWVEGAGPIVLGPTTFLFQTVQDGVFYTSDTGEHWDNVTGGGFPQVYRAKDGEIYMASMGGGVRSADGTEWEKPANMPQGVSVIGDGDRMFTSWVKDDKAAYWAATEDDGADWVQISAPDVAPRGENFAMDRDHHLLYAAHRAGGIWRMVTQ